MDVLEGFVQHVDELVKFNVAEDTLGVQLSDVLEEFVDVLRVQLGVPVAKSAVVLFRQLLHKDHFLKVLEVLVQSHSNTLHFGTLLLQLQFYLLERFFLIQAKVALEVLVQLQQILLNLEMESLILEFHVTARH